jgi:hypothetical protein
MKNKKIAHCRNNSKIKYQNRRKPTLTTQMHDRSHSWLGTSTSIQKARVKVTV